MSYEQSVEYFIKTYGNRKDDSAALTQRDLERIAQEGAASPATYRDVGVEIFTAEAPFKEKQNNRPKLENGLNI